MLRVKTQRLILGIIIILSWTSSRASNIEDFITPTTGVVAGLEGSITLQSAQSRELIRAQIGSSVEVGDLVITSKGSKAKILMVDGNTFDVGENTQFTLQKYKLDSRGVSTQVQVALFTGTLRSIVKQKYGERNKIFQVKTPSSLISTSRVARSIETSTSGVSVVSGFRGNDFLTTYDRRNRESRVVSFEGVVEFIKSFKEGFELGRALRVEPGVLVQWAYGMARPQRARLGIAKLSQYHENTTVRVSNLSLRHRHHTFRREPSSEKQTLKTSGKPLIKKTNNHTWDTSSQRTPLSLHKMTRRERQEFLNRNNEHKRRKRAALIKKSTELRTRRLAAEEEVLSYRRVKEPIDLKLVSKRGLRVSERSRRAPKVRRKTWW